MTNREKLQQAAELIIAFGLDGTLWSPDRLRHEATCAPIRITWEPVEKCRVRLHVDEHKGAVRIRVEAKMGNASPDHALEAADMLKRVALLACKAETAIANAEYVAREAT